MIEEKLESYNWIKGLETKKIGGYNCRRAVLTNSEKDVEAWFTEEIKNKDGPKGYWGLPGLILELTEDNQTVSFSYIRILSKESFEINPPVEGKK